MKIKKITGVKNELKLLTISLFTGLCVTFIGVCGISIYASATLGSISGKVIRFHVVANSDTEEDQSLKLLLRDAVLSKYSEELNGMQSVDETKEFLETRLMEIENYSEEFVKSLGYDYQVSTTFGRSFFPTRDYGGISFPAGQYDALRITIGEGNGKNFWCVMFPPLCFVDAAYSKVTDFSVSSVKNILSEEEFKIISENNQSPGQSYKVKFKIIEWWGKFFGKNSSR